MSVTICKIDGCERKFKGRGYCNTHYLRWLRHGDPLVASSRAPWDPEESFTARVAWDGEHLIWTGTQTGDGYGQIWDGARQIMAHRYAWERVNGPIPDGMVIDHTCWIRACVLTGHLRPATPAQNAQSLSGAMSGRKHNLPRGVHRSGNRFTANVKHNGQYHYLGTFSTPEEASEAASAKRAELFGEFAGAA